MTRNIVLSIFVISLLAVSVAVRANSNDGADPLFPSARDELSLRATATGTWMKFIKVYDAGLYAPGSAESEQVLQSDLPLSLEIRYRVDVTQAQLIEAAMTALRRQHDQPTLDGYAAQIERLHDHYRDVSEGDRFRLDYTPAKGLVLYFNDSPQAVIDDPVFARLYLGIWLAEPALSTTVRQALLNWQPQSDRDPAAQPS